MYSCNEWFSHGKWISLSKVLTLIKDIINTDFDMVVFSKMHHFSAPDASKQREKDRQEPSLPQPLTSLSESAKAIFMCAMNKFDFSTVKWSLCKEKFMVRLCFEVLHFGDLSRHTIGEGQPTSHKVVSPGEDGFQPGSVLPVTSSLTNNCQSSPDQFLISSWIASSNARTKGDKNIPNFANKKFLKKLDGARLELLTSLTGLKYPNLWDSQKKLGPCVKIKYGLLPDIFTYHFVRGNKKVISLLKTLPLKSGKKKPKLRAVTRIGQKHYYINCQVLLSDLYAYVKQFGERVPFKMTVVRYYKGKIVLWMTLSVIKVVMMIASLSVDTTGWGPSQYKDIILPV